MRGLLQSCESFQSELALFMFLPEFSLFPPPFFCFSLSTFPLPSSLPSLNIHTSCAHRRSLPATSGRAAHTSARRSRPDRDPSLLLPARPVLRPTRLASAAGQPADSWPQGQVRARVSESIRRAPLYHSCLFVEQRSMGSVARLILGSNLTQLILGTAGHYPVS